MTTDAQMPELLPDLGFGTVGTDRHPVVRYHLGWNCGDTFGLDSDYDGLALTIEVADETDAQAMIEAISRRADPCASGQVRALEWTQGTRKDDRTAHCECGTFSVGSDDNGGWFAILRHITPDQQCLDLEIGWSDNRALAMDDCEHERRSRILAALTPAPQPAGEAVPFPKPGRKEGGEPCGECRLQAGETCDICGAVANTPQPSVSVVETLADLVSWFEGGPSPYGPWIIMAGPYGADDAIEAARAALRALKGGE